jgi:DNA-directed RNA polymerase subunit RPC12/RpoP
MSEFKYACPVCGQHMMCDSSQSGTVMECPTCFQKITAPQAPASDDTKFIITGTKKSERPAPKFTGAEPGFVPAAKGFSGALVVVIILVFIGAAVVYVYHGAKFSIPFLGPTYGRATLETNQSPAKAQVPSRSALIAPHASDANWMLNLGGMVNFPDEPAAGRIHGQDFLADRANFSTNGILTIRAGTRGPFEFGLTASFSGATIETLAGKTFNIATNVTKAARLTLRWRDGSQAMRDNFDGGYAMRLEFGTLVNNRLPGKIYVCTPDETKSYIAGTFNIEIRRPRPPRQN